MKAKDSLGDRMKKYEGCYNQRLTHRMPVVIRCDGKAFHTLTRICEKPFDRIFMNAMLKSTAEVAKNLQGFKVAFTQSDECSFLITDFDTVDTQGWFNYELNKMVSVSASMMSVFFNKNYDVVHAPAFFDSRVFNIPKEDVDNYFLWRAKDWERNSLQMYARSFFSHKELHMKNRAAIHEMLHGIGKNWAGLDSQIKNGSWLFKLDLGIVSTHDVLPTYQAVSDFIGMAQSSPVTVSLS